MEQGTSRSLIELVRADDADAWQRLVTLYAPLVAHWCRRMRLREDDLADVFQEVFQAVAAHLADFRQRQPNDTFRGWLRVITLNKVRDHWRRAGHEPQAVGGSIAQQQWSQVPSPEESGSESSVREPDDAETALERRLFQRAMELIREEFEPRTWQAFWQTAVEGRAAKEVGDELRMTPGAVRVAKSRVLQRLRAELGDVSE